VGVLVGIGVISLAPAVVPAVWGSAYGASVPVVRVLFVGVPFLYMSYVSTFLAQALRLESRVVWIMAAALAFNVSVNAVVIPTWGTVGAAWTTVIGEILLALTLVSLVAEGTRRVRRSERATVGAA
jgi:O-antigen/teichoic acid export membrane protein